MNLQYLIGVDLGTSGTKTVLFDVHGKEIASALVEYPMYQPHNGWAEQDPEDWWKAAMTTIKAVIDKSGVNPGDIAGLSLSGQMHGLVLTDDNGNALGRSIIWCDNRTIESCEEFTRLVGGRERLIQIAANPALTGFTAGKVLWVREHEPEIWAKARHIQLPKDYVRLKLTGEYHMDMSDASGTNLLDVPHRCWSKEICEKTGIPMEMLPPLVESSDVAGHITEEASRLTGLPVGMPVAAGAGEHSIDAPMPGKIVKLVASEGQAVKAGDVLLILEAMKMQNEIAADADGVVKTFNVTAGQSVKVHDSLVILG